MLRPLDKITTFIKLQKKVSEPVTLVTIYRPLEVPGSLLENHYTKDLSSSKTKLWPSTLNRTFVPENCNL